MSKLLVSNVYAVEGDLYQVMGEDEMLYVYDIVIEAVVDGDIYHHKHVFKGHLEIDMGQGYTAEHANMNCKRDAEKLLARIYNEGNGWIDTDHWECVGNLSEQEDPLDRLEREWSDNSDHFCEENYITGR